MHVFHMLLQVLLITYYTHLRLNLLRKLGYFYLFTALTYLEKLIALERWNALTLFIIIAKIIAFILFCITSAYVLLLGVKKTEIKVAYSIASCLLIIMMVVVT